jgi:multidrug resistance efflux pump
LKPLKLAAGALLVCGGLYVVIGEQMAGTSADAVINAQVTTLRAPVNGDLTLEIHRLGARFSRGEVVGRVSDPRPADERVVDLARTLALTRDDLKRLQEQEATLAASREILSRQASDYARGRVLQLEARLAEARALMEAAQARQREVHATFQRAQELNRSGVQTVADLNRARSGSEIGLQDIEVLRSRSRYLSIELDAAQRGVFIGDNTNDSPVSQQRLREIEQRLAELAGDIRERNSRIALLESELDGERVRLTRAREARLVAPSHSILWEIVTSSGEYVGRGQEVARMVDCATTMVTASVRESVYNQMKVGDPAQFRLFSGASVHDGTVARLAGSGAESIYRSLAIGPSGEHLKRYDVTIAVPTLAADPQLNCAVGRTGRVVFAPRPLDAWRSFRARIGLP